jgi:hypothetical protein
MFQGPEYVGPKEMNPPPIQGPVVFELKGSLSPKKKMRANLLSSNKMGAGFNNSELTGDKICAAQDSRADNSSVGKIKERRKELGLLTPHKMPFSQHKVSIFIQ